MKNLLITIGLVLVVTVFATAQDVQQTDGPVITFEESEHDYGTITKGADGGCVFKFTNTGNEVLVISDVRKSCGCTTPTWSKEPVLPGQSGEIKVGYNTNIVGTFAKNITVMSNAVNANVTLTIKGNVVAE